MRIRKQLFRTFQLTRRKEPNELPRARALVLRLSPILLLGCVWFSLAAPQQKAPPSPATTGSLNERIARYERADREQWQKPDEVVKVLGLHSGDVVADIGAGSGYFTRRFARAVAPGGKVFAVDIDGEILEYLAKEAEKESLHNIVTIVSKEDDPLLPEGSVDLVFFCDTTHHIRDRVPFYRKVARALRKGGRMAIIDFPPEANAKGFCPHDPRELVSSEQVIREAEEAGFTVVKEFTFLPRQYFLVFEKREP